MIIRQQRKCLINHYQALECRKGEIEHSHRNKYQKNFTHQRQTTNATRHCTAQTEKNNNTDFTSLISIIPCKRTPTTENNDYDVKSLRCSHLPPRTALCQCLVTAPPLPNSRLHDAPPHPFHTPPPLLLLNTDGHHERGGY